MSDEPRDIYEVANQLSGYVDTNTPAELAAFLERESNEAAVLAERLERAEAHVRVLQAAVSTAAGRLNWCVSARPGVGSEAGGRLVSRWAAEMLDALASPPGRGDTSMDPVPTDERFEPLSEHLALLGTFDVTDHVDTDDLALLTRISDICEEAPQDDGGVPWTLKPNQRDRILRHLFVSERLVEVARQSTPAETDHLGRALKQIVTGTRLDVSKMGREQVEAAYHAANFLRAAGLTYNMSRLDDAIRQW